jgi:hypothetical protein
VTPELLFTVANAAPLPIWAAWVLAPRSRLARALADSLWPWALLGAFYVAILAVSMTSGPRDGSFSSLAGVMAMFRSPWTVLAGWIHYIAFDLFVARWMMRDAPEAGYWLSPILLLTLMLGPAGLLVYLALRPWLRGRKRGSGAPAT